MGRSSKKAKRGAAVAPAADADAMDSAETLGGEHHQAPPPDAPAEEVTDAGEAATAAAANGEATADEQTRDSSSLESGDGEAATLKRLNGILVSTANRERKRVAALEARLAELSADADADAAAVADAERAVLLAAVTAPLRAAEEERAALLERLAAARDSLERSEFEAAREAGARAEDAARLQAAVAENGQLLEQLRAKEDEAAAAAERVAALEAEVAGLEAQSSDLRAERIELEAMRVSARDVESQKAALESSFNEFKKDGEVYKQETEVKIQDQLKELEALHSRKAELEAKVSSLEAELSEGVARNHELELNVEKLEAEKVFNKEEAEKLQAMFAEMEQKHNVVVAEVTRLESEIDRLVKANEAAAVAHNAEKKTMEAELEMLKGNMDRVQVEKDDALGMVLAKEAEAAKLKDELQKLHIDMAELRAVCDELDGKSSCLEQKQNVMVAEVARLESEIDQLVKAKEAAAVAHDADKKVMKAELEMLKGNAARIQADKDDALGTVHAKDAEAGKLRDELKKLHGEMAELRAICDDLDGKSSCLHDEKIVVLKELEEEKAAAEKLKFKIQELESYNRDNDHEIGVLKADVTGRDKQINDLNAELEQLQLAVAEAEHRGNNVVWTWLAPATTSVLAAASFVYAARSR